MTPDVRKICQILEEITGREFDPAHVTEKSAYIKDLGLSSLETVDLAMAIEDHYQITVETADLPQIATVGASIRYIEKKLTA